LPASLRGRIVYSSVAGFVIFFGLILLGLRETYLQNPIFGADPWEDYLELAAWAVGADLARRATRSAVTGALSGRWNLPSLRRGNAPGSEPGAPAENPIQPTK